MRKCCRGSDVHFANLSIRLKQPQDEKTRGAQYEFVVGRSGKRMSERLDGISVWQSSYWTLASQRHILQVCSDGVIDQKQVMPHLRAHQQRRARFEPETVSHPLAGRNRTIFVVVKLNRNLHRLLKFVLGYESLRFAELPITWFDRFGHLQSQGFDRVVWFLSSNARKTPAEIPRIAT